MLIRLAILLVLTVGSTLIHGQLSQRWSVSADFQQNNDLVRSFPKEFNTWEYLEDANALSPNVIAELGVTEYISRVYTNGTNSVTLLLMAGRTERLIRHSPQICYGASGNTLLKSPTTASLEIDDKPHELRVLPIQGSTNLVGDFTVVYGYASGGIFLSPENPRLTYHGQPSIKKIQVLCNSGSEKSGEMPEYAKPFIEEVCRYIQENDGTK